jgi:hypothetical protein
VKKEKWEITFKLPGGGVEKRIVPHGGTYKLSTYFGNQLTQQTVRAEKKGARMTSRTQNRGYYHDAALGQEDTEITLFDSDPTSESRGTWHGPFKTWQEAKQNAIEFYQVDKRHAQIAIDVLRKKRAPKGRPR